MVLFAKISLCDCLRIFHRGTRYHRLAKLFSHFTDLLQNAVSALLEDDAFTLPSGPARSAYSTATRVAKWIKDHPQAARTFEQQLTTSMQTKCLKFRQSSMKIKREKMWSAYHMLCTSDAYVNQWKAFLFECGVAETSSMFCQYVGDHVFEELIKTSFPLVEPAASSDTPSQSSLTHKEQNAVCYAAGWVPRALKKKLSKSTHHLSKDLKLCLLDLLDDGDEEANDTKAWVDLVNRGGLRRVNDLTFEVFLAMEYQEPVCMSKPAIETTQNMVTGYL